MKLPCSWCHLCLWHFPTSSCQNNVFVLVVGDVGFPPSEKKRKLVFRPSDDFHTWSKHVKILARKGKCENTRPVKIDVRITFLHHDNYVQLFLLYVALGFMPYKRKLANDLKILLRAWKKNLINGKSAPIGLEKSENCVFPRSACACLSSKTRIAVKSRKRRKSAQVFVGIV